METKKVIIAILITAFGLAIENVQLVSAGCKTSCNANNNILNCGGAFDCFYAGQRITAGADDGACILGTPKKCNPSVNYDVSCSDANMQCKESNCNGLTGSDGDSCLITMGKEAGGVCVGGGGTEAKSSGAVWDASGTRCVICNTTTHKEQNNCGDSAGLYLDFDTQTCTGLSDGNFESACGADASCDEKTEGDGCGGTNICDANGQCVVAATCDTNPTVEISPPSQSSSKGDTLTYTIKVTNNDDTSCVTASRIFNLTQAQPGGWGAGSFGSTSLTVNKDDSENTTYDLTSPGGAAVGNYAFIITATDNADGSKKHSADGVYNVTTCPPGIDPDDKFKFTDNLYVRGDGGTVAFGDKTLSLSLDNSGTANAYTVWIKNPGGHVEASGTVAAGDSTFLSYGLKPGDSLGTWTGEISSATDCRVATIAVECTKDSHCAGTDICNSDNECEAAPAPAPAPACIKTEVSEVTCDDGIDNDCDGFFDCDDITCVGTSACSVLPPSPGPTACDPNSWFFCNPLRTNVETLAQGGKRIIGYILGLIGSVALLLVVISGAMYMTSAGNEERIASSKRILTGAVIGLGIALLAYSLLAVIMNVLNM